MAKEHTAALEGMALCRTLTGSELAAIAAIIETREIAAGKELFREGDPGDGLYLVVTGEIDVVKRGPAGEHSLAHLGAGGVLGEMSLITADARSATGRAIVQTSVLHLPAPAFRALLDAGAIAALKIGTAIAEVLAHRVATMNGVVLDLAAKVDAARSAHSPLKTQDLAELHRKMQVWSF